ncbi:hypothetical protein ACVBIL_10300 [Shewanella sp. 125m-7]
MKYLLFLILPFFSFSSLSSDMERVQTNLASDFSSCSSYFLLMSQALVSSGQDGSLYKQSSINSFRFASELSNEKVSEARVKLAYKEMHKELDGNWSNSAILIEKYSDLCVELLESPEKRLKYWTSKY